MIFQDAHYEELKNEINKHLNESEEVFGVVELNDGRFDFILGFEFLGEVLERWLIIVFDNGVRCSSDFDIEKLRRWL